MNSTARPSGTEYACAIERQRRSDTSGITIILICGVMLACAIVGTWIAPFFN